MTAIVTRPTHALQRDIDEFLEILQGGVNALLKAGEKLVGILDEHPKAADFIMDQAPHVTPSVLGNLELLGRKQRHIDLLFKHGPGVERLAKCPYSVQDRYTKEPIPVAVRMPDGSIDILLIMFYNMTADQAYLGIGPDGIRAMGEQRAILQHRVKNTAQQEVIITVPSWSIRGNKMVLPDGTALSAKELSAILAQITK